MGSESKRKKKHNEEDLVELSQQKMKTRGALRKEAVPAVRPKVKEREKNQQAEKDDFSREKKFVLSSSIHFHYSLKNGKFKPKSCRELCPSLGGSRDRSQPGEPKQHSHRKQQQHRLRRQFLRPDLNEYVHRR
jgi:hypothetical protein